jgi:hypothetical protein
VVDCEVCTEKIYRQRPGKRGRRVRADWANGLDDRCGAHQTEQLVKIRRVCHPTRLVADIERTPEMTFPWKRSTRLLQSLGASRYQHKLCTPRRKSMSDGESDPH